MEKILTTNELAELFGVVATTIWRWKREGCPYHMTSGVSKGYKESEVREWLQNRFGEKKIDADINLLKAEALCEHFFIAGQGHFDLHRTEVAHIIEILNQDDLSEIRERLDSLYKEWSRNRLP